MRYLKKYKIFEDLDTPQKIQDMLDYLQDIFDEFSILKWTGDERERYWKIDKDTSIVLKNLPSELMEKIAKDLDSIKNNLESFVDCDISYQLNRVGNYGATQNLYLIKIKIESFENK